MSEEREYILGTDREEIDRLRFQHQAWVKEAYALWERAEFRERDVVLDLGCGPGFTSFELAHVVGREGRVIARDESARFLSFLRAERDRLGLAQVETSLGRVEDLDLGAGSIDAAYARWLFCWLAEPGAVLERVARALRSGGALALQEYVDWAAMKLVPSCAIFDAGVAACMRSWDEGGGRIDVAEVVPALAEDCGLCVECFRPIARIGRVGSLEWRWLGGFFASYLPKLVERGAFGAAELREWRDEWSRRTRGRVGYCLAPTMADLLLRKP
jgi:SAM-dependent methyltransferase